MFRQGDPEKERSDVIREIVTIDEDLCNGCGECVPSCAEGAIQIIDGKARLVSDTLCDGLGACLGHCPQGAIKIERREADEFDEAAVAGRVKPTPPKHVPAACAGATPEAGSEPPSLECGCPGTRLKVFNRAAGPDRSAPGAGQQSELTHWPVQLRLLPPQAPVLQGASLLVAADCVPVACPDFHTHLLRGRAVVIGCPKFDDLEDYTNRLEAMIRHNTLKEITVARMEVPCCGGILRAVVEARQRADSSIPIIDMVIGTCGQVLS